MNKTFSTYQQNIFTEASNPSTGDMIVNAVAGSGKTTTIVELAKQLPIQYRNSAVMIAFNKHIADELQTKLPDGVLAATVHSLGRKALWNKIRPRGKWDVNGRKYNELIDYYYNNVLGVSKFDEDSAESKETLASLLRLVMVTLTDAKDHKAISELADHFSLEITGSQWNVFLAAIPILIKWGMDGTPGPDQWGRFNGIEQTISFDDMIFAPVHLNLKVQQFDRIYVDECQDINAVQRAFILKMRSPGGKIVWVGDRNQAIYGFTGADSQSFDAIKQITGAKEMPLSVCYRCPSSHVEQAKTIVPQIEAAPNAKTGVVGYMNRDSLASFAQVNDLIICRCTAPLVKAAFEIIADGKPAKVRGRDIGKSLIKVIDAVVKIKGYTWEKFIPALEEYERGMTEALNQKRGNSELAIQALEDKCDSVEAIYMAKLNQCSNAACLRSAIEDLFSDDKQAVYLSSVHKAKGLEAQRVIILEPELMPHPKAEQDWELVQEQNLKYVALTRSLAEMYFVPK